MQNNELRVLRVKSKGIEVTESLSGFCVFDFEQIHSNVYCNYVNCLI